MTMHLWFAPKTGDVLKTPAPRRNALLSPRAARSWWSVGIAILLALTVQTGTARPAIAQDCSALSIALQSSRDKEIVASRAIADACDDANYGKICIRFIQSRLLDCMQFSASTECECEAQCNQPTEIGRIACFKRCNNDDGYKICSQKFRGGSAFLRANATDCSQETNRCAKARNQHQKRLADMRKAYSNLHACRSAPACLALDRRVRDRMN